MKLEPQSGPWTSVNSMSLGVADSLVLWDDRDRIGDLVRLMLQGHGKLSQEDGSPDPSAKGHHLHCFINITNQTAVESASPSHSSPPFPSAWRKVSTSCKWPHVEGFLGLPTSSQIKTQRLLINYESLALAYACPTGFCNLH